MTAMTYSKLVGDVTKSGSIRHWMNDATIPSEDILNEAERTIYHEIRAREMVHRFRFEMARGTSEIEIPDDYRRSYFLQFDDSLLNVEQLLGETILAAQHRIDGQLAEGTPERYAVLNVGPGPRLVFDTALDETRSGTFWYYRALPSLSADNEENFLTKRYPRLLRSMSCMFAAEFLRDMEQQAYWRNLSGLAINEVNVDQDRELEGARIDVNVPGGAYPEGFNY